MTVSHMSAAPRFQHRDIRIVLPIKASPEAVYSCLTSARQLCSWWLERAETETRNGGRLRMVWPAYPAERSREARGLFVDLEPGRKAAWMWAPGSRSPGVPPLNTFFIEPRRGGCMVTLLHAGFLATPTGAKRMRRWMERWEDCLAKLALYLESGKTCKGDVISLDELSLLRKAPRRPGVMLASRAPAKRVAAHA